MTKVPKYWNKAKRYLSKKDKVMSKLIKSYQGPSEKVLTTRKNIFFSLYREIDFTIFIKPKDQACML